MHNNRVDEDYPEKIDKEIFIVVYYTAIWFFLLFFFRIFHGVLYQEKCIFVDVKNNAQCMRTKRVAHIFAVAIFVFRISRANVFRL